MPDNVFELVAKDVESTLAAITQAEYGFAPLVRRIGTAKRPTSKTVEPGADGYGPGTAFGVEIEIRQPSIKAKQPEEFGKSYFEQEFQLVCFVEQSDTSETSTDSINNQIYGAVIQALMEDANRGGYAIDTMVGDSHVFVNQSGAYEGIEIGVAVNVRTAQFNPDNL